MQREDGYVIFRRNPEAKVKLFCFHHAGGSSLSMIPLVRNLPEEVEVYLFELPGRGMSKNKPFVANYRDGKQFFLERITSCIDRPTILLGHSLGGLFSYSLAVALAGDYQRFIKKLIVSSTKSPRTVIKHAVHPVGPFVVRTVESIRNDMIRLGGLPQELAEDHELLKETIEVTGRDFHLIDTFPEDEQMAIPYPFELWLGRQDGSVSQEEIELWEKISTNNFSYQFFEGGHFYLYENEEPARRLLEILKEECTVY